MLRCIRNMLHAACCLLALPQDVQALLLKLLPAAHGVLCVHNYIMPSKAFYTQHSIVGKVLISQKANKVQAVALELA